MRSVVLGCLILLSACAPAEPPVHGETPGHDCNLAGTEVFMGRIPTNATSTEILRVSHAAVLRWAPPGVMLTMDFRADRVTVHLGPDHKITQINCG